MPTTGAVVLGTNVPNQVQALPEQQLQPPQAPAQNTGSIASVDQFQQLIDTVDPNVLNQYFQQNFGITTDQFRSLAAANAAQQYRQQPQQPQQPQYQQQQIPQPQQPPQPQQGQQEQQTQASPFDSALRELQSTWQVDQNEALRRLRVISEQKGAFLEQNPQFDTLDNVKLWWAEMDVQGTRASQPDRNSSIISSAVPQRPQYLFSESQIARMSEQERRANDAMITQAYATNQVLLDL